MRVSPTPTRTSLRDRSEHDGGGQSGGQGRRDRHADQPEGHHGKPDAIDPAGADSVRPRAGGQPPTNVAAADAVSTAPAATAPNPGVRER